MPFDVTLKAIEKRYQIESANQKSNSSINDEEKLKQKKEIRKKNNCFFKKSQSIFLPNIIKSSHRVSNTTTFVSQKRMKNYF